MNPQEEQGTKEEISKPGFVRERTEMTSFVLTPLED